MGSTSLVHKGSLGNTLTEDPGWTTFHTPVPLDRHGGPVIISIQRSMKLSFNKVQAFGQRHTSVK